MRIVFMGTPDFAVPSLKILLDNQYPVVGVVTAPDRPSGRGQHLSTSPVKDFATTHDLSVLQPEKLSDPSFVEKLIHLDPELIVVVAFRKLPADVIRFPKHGAFNLHASLLPKYRGAAPINWAIINGETETGVTTFFLEETIDTGKIILQAKVSIEKDETAGELHDKLADVGAEIVLHTVRLIESGKTNPSPQDNLQVSQAPKIFKEQCKINWSQKSREVHDFIRGLSPRPGAYTVHRGTILKVYRSKVAEESSSSPPGEVMCADQQLVVSTGDGGIELKEIQQEGRRQLPAIEFLRGYRISVGEKLQ